MRIAVCDDEKVFLQNICNKIDSFYKSLDVCCIPFGDGSEIIRAYECGQRFDAVFLDIEMKKLDGMNTAERIRSEGLYLFGQLYERANNRVNSECSEYPHRYGNECPKRYYYP